MTDEDRKLMRVLRQVTAGRRRLPLLDDPFTAAYAISEGFLRFDRDKDKLIITQAGREELAYFQERIAET